jgi:hypothetical protein
MPVSWGQRDDGTSRKTDPEAKPQHFSKPSLSALSFQEKILTALGVVFNHSASQLRADSEPGGNLLCSCPRYTKTKASLQMNIRRDISNEGASWLSTEQSGAPEGLGLQGSGGLGLERSSFSLHVPPCEGLDGTVTEQYPAIPVTSAGHYILPSVSHWSP